MFSRRNRTSDDFSDYFEEATETARRERNRRERTPDRPPGSALESGLAHTIVLGLIGGLLLFLVRTIGGQTLFEKTLKALVAPVGLVWVFLFIALWHGLLARKGKLALACGSAWLLLTLGGNSFVALWLAASLQSTYENVRVENLPALEVILVTGGGTSTAPSGQPQASSAGDRVLVAARMAMRDPSSRIVCSGNNALTVKGVDATPASEMKQLLVQLGVPESRLELIGGQNTAEEMAEFAQWLERNGAGASRIGIVTSAWHMKRTLRLAGRHSIEAQPIPADFIVIHPRATPNLFIPGAQNLLVCEKCLHEWLAALVGR